MGENGYNFAQSKFQWEIVGQSIKKGIDESLPKSKQELTYQ
jgi:hypothetical protein